MEPQKRKIAFEIVVRRVERPLPNKPTEEFDWICQTLGFFEPIDKDKTAATIFKELVRASESGEALTSSALANRIDMSRGSVINHLNNLMRSGLVVRVGRYYEPRSSSMYRTIEEIEEDVERIFAKIKRTARNIDEELGLSPPNEE